MRVSNGTPQASHGAQRVPHSRAPRAASVPAAVPPVPCALRAPQLCRAARACMMRPCHSGVSGALCTVHGSMNSVAGSMPRSSRMARTRASSRTMRSACKQSSGVATGWPSSVAASSTVHVTTAAPPPACRSTTASMTSRLGGACRTQNARRGGRGAPWCTCASSARFGGSASVTVLKRRRATPAEAACARAAAEAARTSAALNGASGSIAERLCEAVRVVGVRADVAWGPYPAAPYLRARGRPAGP